MNIEKYFPCDCLKLFTKILAKGYICYMAQGCRACFNQWDKCFYGDIKIMEFGFISEYDEFQHVLLLSVHDGLKWHNNE